MLSPDYLDNAPDALVALFQDVEDSILQDVCRRIGRMGGMSASSNWQLWRYQQTEAVRQSVVKKMSVMSGRSRKEIRTMLKDAATVAMEQEDEIYYHYGLKPSQLTENTALQNLLTEGYIQTNGTWENLTATTANTVSGEFENALDRSWLKVSSGAFDYNRAIKSACDELADSMKYVTYPTGHKDTLEVAVRRATLTGVNQTIGKLQIARMDEMGCDFVEVTAHAGARPEHAAWQGKVYHRGGEITQGGKHYKDFESATGYGTGAGLCGWNCRHTFFATFPELGAPPAWTRRSLAELDAKTVTYKGKQYTRYEANQLQRAAERKVRKYKRRYLAELEAGVDESDLAQTAVKLRAAREEMKHLVSETGGRVDSARTYTAKFSRSQASKATALSQAHHSAWIKSINAQSSSLKSVAKYYEAKYNNSEEYQLLMQYNHSVKTGWLSPLTGFDLYKDTHNRIQTELVGESAVDGTTITGYKIHFMERMFGTMVDPKKLKENHEIIRRSGVKFDDIVDCLMNGSTRPTKNDGKGRPSKVYFSAKCSVSVNPETGELVQCNPYLR